MITAAGRSAIGIETPTQKPEPPVEGTPLGAKPISKIAAVTALLERSGGATLAGLIEVTGWLPHTTRAALTGLRKKGLKVEKTRRHDATAYISRW